MATKKKVPDNTKKVVEEAVEKVVEKLNTNQLKTLGYIQAYARNKLLAEAGVKHNSNLILYLGYPNFVSLKHKNNTNFISLYLTIYHNFM
mgnify:CR=1 FL=1